MAAVERVGWQDTQKVNFYKEIYRKENRIRNEFLLKWEEELKKAEAAAAAGAQCPEEEEPPAEPEPCSPVSESSKQDLTPEERDTQLRKDLSKNMWKRVNPGYVDDVSTMTSTQKTDFVYDNEEIESLRTDYHRKRDNFTNYVEASARYKLLMPKGKPGEQK